MALNALPALQVQTPQVNGVGNYMAVRQANTQQRDADFQHQQQVVQALGVMGLGALNGNIDGTADPKTWEAVLDHAEQSGMDPKVLEPMRGKPQMASVLARGSLDVLKYAQDKQTFDLQMQKFGLEIEKAKKDLAAGTNADETYAMQPTYYKVPDGKGGFTVKFGQLGNKGTFHEVPLPDGAEPAVPVQQLDTGTSFQPVTKFGDTAPGAAPTPINNAQAAHDTAIGKGSGEAEIALPEKKAKAEGALHTLESKKTLVSDTIDKALQQSDNAFSTGFLGDWAKAIPGTPPYDLYQNLLTIKANIGFDQLQQMRDNSPTGGALGQVSDTENQLLAAVEGSLAQGQSKEQLQGNLKKVKALYQSMLDQKKAAFDHDFGGGSAPAAPASGGGAGANDMDPSKMSDEELLTFLGGQ